jgi:hypothetical protein
MHKYGQHDILEGMERIFSYLDSDGVIHLRSSQIMFLFMALILSNKITLRENTIDGFLSQLNEFQDEINQV